MTEFNAIYRFSNIKYLKFIFSQYLIFQPLYNIRTKDELLAHLKKNAIISGFDVNTIKEVFPKINHSIQVMILLIYLSFNNILRN